MLDAPGIFDWARAAKPGEAAVYALGEVPPRAEAAMVSRLADAGLIDATRRRIAGDRWQFLIQRRAKPFNLAPARRTRRAYGPATAETVILRMIREAIRLKQPCPTNTEFAEGANLSGKIAASYRLRKLVRDGKIELTDHGPFERRVATDVATGRSTARAAL